MSQNEPLNPQLGRVQTLALGVGVVGLLACAAGWWLAPEQAPRSYLFAYMFWLGLSLGCFGIAMLHQLSGGAWGFAIRRILEAAAMVVPLMALLFVPIALDASGLLGPSHLYEWAHAEVVAGDAILQSKSAYLNVGGFLARAALYFVIWIALALIFRRLSGAQDRGDNPALVGRLRLLARVGVVCYIMTLTFASVDWVMSIEPHWFSSIFGVLFLAGQGLSSLAFAIVVSQRLSGSRPLSEVVTVDRFNDLGNLLLAFVMFWTYINLSQYLIIWSGNIPEEVEWYLHRTEGGWSIVIQLVLGFQFVLPFLALLSRRNKRTPGRLAALALLIMAIHMLEMFWRVMPTFQRSVLEIFQPINVLLNLAAPIGIGGLWVAAFLWLLRSRPLVPQHDPRDPRLTAALEHGH